MATGHHPSGQMRYGAVSYLNACPLIEGLEPLTLDTPSGLARRVDAGELDVSLLPVAAAVGLDLARVGSLGIAAEGPVDSVLLFLRCPVAELRSVRLDPASRTSRVLARVLLREVHDVDPRVVDHGDADAELLIGDAALIRWAAGDEQFIDLAAAWTAWTGLPFVFAAWYGDQAAEAELEAAYARGKQRIDAYAQDSDLPLAAPLLASYLRERIRFRIGPRESEGLARFLELSRAHGLL